MKRLSIRIDDETRAFLRTAARDLNLSMVEVVRRCLWRGMAGLQREFEADAASRELLDAAVASELAKRPKKSQKTVTFLWPDAVAGPQKLRIQTGGKSRSWRLCLPLHHASGKRIHQLRASELERALERARQFLALWAHRKRRFQKSSRSTRSKKARGGPGPSQPN